MPVVARLTRDRFQASPGVPHRLSPDAGREMQDHGGLTHLQTSIESQVTASCVPTGFSYVMKTRSDL
jgi:hypothetical protein